jgi:hypothetical protein
MLASSSTTIQNNSDQASHSLRTSPSSTNIYSRYRLPSTTSTETTSSSNNEVMMDHKRSYTLDNLSSLAYFTSTDTLPTELTPSAAIRDRYYQSSRYLQDNHHADELEDYEDDTIYEENAIQGDVFDYRPGDSNFYTKPNDSHSVYSVNDSIISLRTEFNGDGDNRSINSIRTVDDRLQGRSTSLLGTNLNSFAAKTAKKVSRSSSIFRNAADKNSSGSKKKLEPFVPVRDHYQHQKDASSIRTVGGTSLLSKLSKSTAPMRAKLSAISHLARNTRVEHSLALPGRKRMAESVYNMPISSPAPSVNTRQTKTTFEKAQSLIPKTLSASSSTTSTSSLNRMITSSSVFVEEPTSLSNKERLPVVYPALLSKVAEAFRDRIALSTKTKDSIKYKDVFDGKEAVVSFFLCFVIRHVMF